MRLTTYLRQLEERGGLPYDAECSECRRERLPGAVLPRRLVSRRTQAALTAGLLAFSAVAPAASYAFGKGNGQRGKLRAQIAQIRAQASSLEDDPNFDPGGESTAIPFDAPPVPTKVEAPDVGNGDDGLIEEEPAADVDAPIADEGDGAAPAPAAPPVAAPEPPPVAAPVVEAPPVPEPAPPVPEPAPPVVEAPPVAAPAPPVVEAPAIVEPVIDPLAKALEASAKRSSKPAVMRSTRAKQKAPVAQAPAAPVAAPVTASSTVTAQAAPAPAQAPTIKAADRAKPGDRSHVIVAGESLWSIATDLLGDEASVADVAGEVRRLWKLNETRIGTGDPNLLMVGTKIRLR